VGDERSDLERRRRARRDKRGPGSGLLEDRLVELGTDYRAGEPFAPHVEVDGNLYTGQNPASAVPLAREILTALTRKEADMPAAANITLVRRLYDSGMAPEVTRRSWPRT
jgi:hypothetical protein